jgi:hypothetical protein
MKCIQEKSKLYQDLAQDQLDPLAVGSGSELESLVVKTLWFQLQT